jgi:predicted AlkP superfamily phosphohydrolase/phosphomutase
MNSRTREEIVRAIAENIEEIGPQLQKYISSKDKYDEFFDISFGNDNATTAQFDIIIDKDNLIPTKNNSYQELKLALQKYGSVIVKFVDGTIDGNTIISISNLLSKYISITKSTVSLALIIGDDATSNAYKLASRPKDKKIGYLIIIERPLLTS